MFLHDEACGDAKNANTKSNQSLAEQEKKSNQVHTLFVNAAGTITFLHPPRAQEKARRVVLINHNCLHAADCGPTANTILALFSVVWQQVRSFGENFVKILLKPSTLLVSCL
jgi:hypothetical protein